MIKRIFHPIGQGAFYSEKHKNFNIVYDCGHWKNTNKFNNVVEQAFSEGEVIDILFISHFDFDHVSKIKILKEHTQIKKVVMPLLHDDEKIILCNLYRVLKFNILTLIEKPKKFFGENTQIIQVIPTEETELSIGDNMIDLDTPIAEQIHSGTILSKTFKKHQYEWVFIPYNFKHQERTKKLENLLSEEGFDVDKLKADPKYTIEKTISQENRKKLHKVYNKLKDKINSNSMLLYSGRNCLTSECKQKVLYKNDINKYLNLRKITEAIEKEITFEDLVQYCKLREFKYKFSNRKKTGCIYTGDANLNQVKIKSVFKRFWEDVGTIQIPHHGDEESFDVNILYGRNEGYYCPISVGENNNYGHPSDNLIYNIIKSGNIPVFVTENPNSGFIECFKYE